MLVNDGCIVRRYQRADAAGVRAVLEATYGALAPPQSVSDWWSFGCPETTGGFMVAEVGGRVVGVQPMDLFRFADAETAVTGGLLIGVAVHPEFRRRGIFTALVRGCEEEAWRQGAAFVTTMPNERSRPGFLKMGYADLGRRRLLLKPLDCRALSKAAIRFPWLHWLVGELTSAVQAVVKPVSRRGAWQVREVGDLPKNLSEIERQHARHFPGLRVQRTATWWRWRYLDSPLRRYRLFEARTSAGEVTGVAAICDEVRDGLRVAYLMDVAAVQPDVVPDLAVTAFEMARDQGAVAAAAVTSSPALSRALRRAGFWMVPMWAPLKRFYSVVRFNPAGEALVSSTWRQIHGWYQTLGDWDNL